jgi:antitoxin ParD1/3/4
MTMIDMLRDRFFEKLDDLEPDKLISVEDMKKLFKETQALSGVSEITDDEIAEEIAAYRRGE